MPNSRVKTRKKERARFLWFTFFIALSFLQYGTFAKVANAGDFVPAPSSAGDREKDRTPYLPFVRRPLMLIFKSSVFLGMLFELARFGAKEGQAGLAEQITAASSFPLLLLSLFTPSFYHKSSGLSIYPSMFLHFMYLFHFNFIYAVRSLKRELTQGLRRSPSFVLSLHPYSLFFCKNVTRFLKIFSVFFKKLSVFCFSALRKEKSPFF